ncbi:MAG: TRAP transporter permease [Rhodospirillales bacterium]
MDSLADRSRLESGIRRFVVPPMGFLLTVVALLFAAEVPIKLGFLIYTEQGLAAILGLALSLIFLTVRAGARDKEAPIPWYDYALAAAGLLVGLYLAYRLATISENFFMRRDEAFVVGLVLVPLILEALRRTAGWSLVIIVVVFLLYGLFGDVIPGKLQGRPKSLYDLLSYLAVDNVAIFGTPLTIVSTVVVMFVFMGQLLTRTGGSEWFTDIACALMGRSRGGSAKIAIVASAFFGTISGSAVANVASTGVITIPLMKEAGFEPKVAGAFEAVASTGGQITPPIMGAAAFLMAEFLQVSYTEVVIAATVPAILYYIAVFIQADLEAARKNIPPVPEDRIPRVFPVLRDGWHFVLPFALLIYALFELNRTPEESALWAAGSLIALSWIFGFRGRRLSLGSLMRAVAATGTTAMDIVVIGAMAGIVIGILSVSGLGFGLTFVLVQFGEQSLYGLLVLTAIVCIVLGMGMPTTALYILVATLAAPPLIRLGVSPMAAHLFVFYFGIVSMITPPVAVAAYVAASLAGSKAIETGFTAMRLGWAALVVPFLFVISPSLILEGDVFEVAQAVITAVLGVWIATSGILGYFMKPLAFLTRTGFIVAGLALLVPATAFDGAGYLEAAGAILAIVVVGGEFLQTRRSRMA